jgi:ABC-type nitrate/sulfonate/bicarbonate transport system substrate-binding protein
VERLRVIGFSRPGAFIVAQGEGGFAAAGLAVEYTQARGSAAQLDSLLRGEFDLAHTAADNVVMRVDRDGADLVVVCVAELGVAQRLVVGPRIADVAELRGKTLGVDAVESGYATLLYAILERRGVPRGSYAVKPVGGTAQRLDALLAGTIAGAMLGPPHDLRALAAGGHVLASAAEDFPGYPALTVAARRSWATAHRDLVARYCSALLGAARWAADGSHRERVIAHLRAEAGSPERAVAMYEAEDRAREVAAPTLAQAAAAIARVVDLRHPGTRADVERYFDASFSAEADAARA